MIDLVRVGAGLGLFLALAATVLREAFRGVSRVWHAPTDREAVIEAGAMFFVVAVLTACVIPLVVVILP